MFTKVSILSINLGEIQYFSGLNDQKSYCSIVLFVHLTQSVFSVFSVKISFEAPDTELTDSQ